MKKYWDKYKGKIAITALVVAYSLWKLNEHNTAAFKEFITENELEETFDAWGHFGLDIRKSEDDPSSIVTMTELKERNAS